MKKFELQIKIDSLACEAMLIRARERKLRQQLDLLVVRRRLTQTSMSATQIDRIIRRVIRRTSLPVQSSQAIMERLSIPIKPEWEYDTRRNLLNIRAHRIDVVRPEARAAQLAYAFLRGKTYASVEAKCYLPPNWERVEQIVRKFGWTGATDKLNAWHLADAEKTLEAA